MSWQPEGWTPDGWQPDNWHPGSGDDVTPPEVTAVAITLSEIAITFSEAVTRGAGYSNSDWGVSAGGGAVLLTYSSGDGTTTMRLTTSRLLRATETATLSWAGTTNGIEDSAGNDLAAFSGQSISKAESVAASSGQISGRVYSVGSGHSRQIRVA